MPHWPPASERERAVGRPGGAKRENEQNTKQEKREAGGGADERNRQSASRCVATQTELSETPPVATSSRAALEAVGFRVRRLPVGFCLHFFVFLQSCVVPDKTTS